MNASKRLKCIAVMALVSASAANPVTVSAASAASTDSMPRYTLRVSPGNFGEYAVNAVRLGMSRNEVTALIGAPSGTSVPHRGGTQLDYNYVDTWGYDAVFSVVIDGGVVVDKAGARRRY